MKIPKPTTLSFGITSLIIVLCGLMTIGASIVNVFPAPKPKTSTTKAPDNGSYMQQSAGLISMSTAGKDSPAVTIGVQDVILAEGSPAVITWSATNKPKSCMASDDWSGTKHASGKEESAPLMTSGEYFFTITCKTEKGTGYAVARVIVIGQDAGTGDPQRRPHVTLSAASSAVQIGSSPRLSWSTTNTPNVCIASGDWSGIKNPLGQQSLNSVKEAATKNYALTCLNNSGMETVSVKVDIVSNVVATAIPATSTAATTSSYRPTSTSTVATRPATTTTTTPRAPTPTAPAAPVTPTTPAGTPPVVTISVSPTIITAGSSATIRWSVTGTTPVTCTAGIAWSGSKNVSGSYSTGVISTGGVYDYALSCSNAKGQNSATARLTVNKPAPVPVYCGGKSPCYGRSDLAAHSSISSCWGWNKDWVIDITRYQPSHPVTRSSNSTSNLANSTATCNHDISAILAGSAAIPGYSKISGSTTHGHKAATLNNDAASQLAAFRVGYYDPNKP